MNTRNPIRHLAGSLMLAAALAVPAAASDFFGSQSSGSTPHQQATKPDNRNTTDETMPPVVDPEGEYLPVTAVPILPTPECDADIDRDGLIDWQDLMIVLAEYGRAPIDAVGPGNPDINRNGLVDFEDLLAVLAHWGASACD